jgi:hypothetical protein
MMKNLILLISITILGIIILSACTPPAPKATPTPSVDALVGDWTGSMYLPEGGDPLGRLDISIQAGCGVGKVCGSYAIPQIPCGGSYTYQGKKGEAFVFEQQLTEGDLKTCGTGSTNEITPLADGTLSQTWTDGVNKTRAILKRK